MIIKYILKVVYLLLDMKKYFLPWLLWLSGLSIHLQTKGSPVRFPVRAHACVSGQVPSRGRAGGNHILMFPSLTFPILSSFSRNKLMKYFLKIKKYIYFLSLFKMFVMKTYVFHSRLQFIMECCIVILNIYLLLFFFEILKNEIRQAYLVNNSLRFK